MRYHIRHQPPPSAVLRTVLAVFAALPILAACAPDAPFPTGPQIGLPSGFRATIVGASVTVLDMYAVDVNNAGQVVGSRNTADGPIAVLWTPTAGLQDLGTLGGSYSAASAINDAGQIVGYSSLVPGSNVRHAFLWTPGHGMQDLGTLGGSFSSASAINEAGQVVGQSSIPGGRMRAFVWTSGEGMQNLGSLDNEFTETVASDINTAGHVVGESYDFANPLGRAAFLWTAGQGMQRLGTLGGTFAVARAINDAGRVVGESTNASGEHRAFLWSAATGMRDLGTLGTGAQSAAFAINEAGEVVGWSDTQGDVPSEYNQHAFLWSADEGMQDLFAFTAMHRAVDINNRRQVVNGYNYLAALHFVSPNRPPVAHIGGPYAGAKKKPIDFDGTRSSDPDGDALTYAWDFGDGTSLVAGPVATHEYNAWGSYTVTLTVSDPAGLSSKQTTTATIAPPGHAKQPR